MESSVAQVAARLLATIATTTAAAPAVAQVAPSTPDSSLVRHASLSFVSGWGTIWPEGAGLAIGLAFAVDVGPRGSAEVRWLGLSEGQNAVSVVYQQSITDPADEPARAYVMVGLGWLDPEPRVRVTLQNLNAPDRYTASAPPADPWSDRTEAIGGELGYGFRLPLNERAYLRSEMRVLRSRAIDATLATLTWALDYRW